MKRLFLAVSAALMACPATAQSVRNCGEHNQVVTWLAEKRGEARQVIGLGSHGAIFEVFASEETGTWTITMTTPNGVTCLKAQGQAFENLAEVLPSKGDDL